jgi:hypothetical protein
MLKRFIRIAEHLMALNNFNSLFAMYCGLGANPIFRLKKTWAELNARTGAIVGGGRCFFAAWRCISWPALWVLKEYFFRWKLFLEFCFLHFVAGGMARACLLYPVSDGCDFVCGFSIFYRHTLFSQRASGKRSNRCSKSTAIRAIFVRCSPRRSAPPFRTLVL